MSVNRFTRIFTDNYEMQKIQSNAESTLNEIITSEFVRGNVISVALDVNDVLINHKLGKVWEGWSVIDQDASAIIYRSATANKNPAAQIILKASAPVNAKIYIF